MTIENAIALVVAVTALLGAIGALYVQVRSVGKQIDGRMQELMTVTAQANLKQGELAGRDFSAPAVPVSVMGGAGTPVPLVPLEPKNPAGPGPSGVSGGA